MNIVETERLRLKHFSMHYLEQMTAINQSTQVMRFFPSVVDRDGTQKLIEHILAHHQQHGFSLYAVEVKATDTFIGFVGLNVPWFAIPNFKPKSEPIVEIGWRLSQHYWGQGFAPEAGKAVIKLAFEELHLQELISFTAKINKPSIRVMEKIGLLHDMNDDFLHPKLEQDSPLRAHVLYKLARKDYQGGD